MSYTVRRLDSWDAIAAASQKWDDLWQRSETSLPTARANLVSLWGKTFEPDRAVRALTIEDAGSLVAAIPLVEGRFLGQSVACLPGNFWSPAGELLIDPLCDVPAVCRRLAEALIKDSWAIARLEPVQTMTARWQALLYALEQRGAVVVRRPRHSVPVVQIHEDWETYFAARTYNHRKQVRKAKKHAERDGQLELREYNQLAPAEVEPLLRACFELEAKGWKGEADGAVLGHPQVWEFFLAQAQQLAAWQELSLVILYHNQQPIAYEYGWRAKGRYFTPKVGYDEAASRYSPGQLLRSILIERFCGRSDTTAIDFLGPLSPATSRWQTYQYNLESVTIGLRGPLARAIVFAYGQLGPMAKRFIGAKAKLDSQPQAAENQSSEAETSAQSLVSAAAQ